MSLFHRISLTAALGVCVGSAAFAQPQPSALSDELTPAERNNVLRDQEVTKREQPDYAPKGADLGGFTLFPSVTQTERFTDNLYYDQTTRRKDLVSTTAPALRLKSDWNVHELELNAGSEIVRHQKYEQEDVENYSFSGAGKVDVTNELAMRAKANWLLGHEPRSSPDDAGGVTPTKTETKGALLGAEYRGPRIRLRGESEATEYNFSDVRKADGSITRTSARNRRVGELRGRVGYEIIPEYVAFSEILYNDRKYNTTDTFGNIRDSHGWEGRLGTEIEISGALRGEVFGSFMKQFYDNPGFASIAGPGGGLALTWTPTGLTTIKAGVKRTIAETTFQYSAGSIAQRYETSVAHELQRNIILEADGSLTQTAYVGTGRHDMLWSGGVTGTYKLNRYVYTALDYHVGRQNNNTTTGQYTENSTFLKLGLQY